MTQVRTQDALVMAPQAPMGFGTSLPVGGTSFALGAAYTSTQVHDSDGVGSQAIPLTGLMRGAVAASERVEVTANGQIGSPNLDLGPLSPGIDGRKGYLGGGAIGVRAFVPFDQTPLQWAWSAEVGAEATHVIVTDAKSVRVTSLQGAWQISGDPHWDDWIRTLPDFRFGTALRIPVAGPVWAVGGAQLQTWPVYWDLRTQTDTCTEFLGGYQDCTTVGNIDAPPSKLVAVFSPTAGATIPIGSTSIQAQVYANLGPRSVQTVPWGAVVMLEHVTGPRGD